MPFLTIFFYVFGPSKHPSPTDGCKKGIRLVGLEFKTVSLPISGIKKGSHLEASRKPATKNYPKQDGLSNPHGHYHPCDRVGFEETSARFVPFGAHYSVTPIMSQRSLEDYYSDDPISWCPGCGGFSILQALKEALVELNKWTGTLTRLDKPLYHE